MNELNEHQINNLSNILDKTLNTLDALSKDLASLPKGPNWLYSLPENKSSNEPLSVPAEIELTQRKRPFVTLLESNDEYCQYKKAKPDLEVSDNLSESCLEKSVYLLTNSQTSYSDLLSCSIENVDIICDKLNVYNDLEQFCIFIQNAKLLLSNEKLIAILTSVFSSKIVNLKTPLENVVIQHIQELTVTFPVCILSGIIDHCLNKNTGPFQTDVLLKIIQVIPLSFAHHTIELLNGHLSEDAVLPLLQSLIERKPNLTGDTVALIVQLIQNLAAVHNQNKKFAVLLISVVTAIENKISKNALEIFKNVAENHKTFLKMVILKKIKEIEDQRK